MLLPPSRLENQVVMIPRRQAAGASGDPGRHQTRDPIPRIQYLLDAELIASNPRVVVRNLLISPKSQRTLVW